MASSPKETSILFAILIVADCQSEIQRSAELQSVPGMVASPLWSSKRQLATLTASAA